jgi:hypothetical protein
METAKAPTLDAMEELLIAQRNDTEERLGRRIGPNN